MVGPAGNEACARFNRICHIKNQFKPHRLWNLLLSTAGVLAILASGSQLKGVLAQGAIVICVVFFRDS